MLFTGFADLESIIAAINQGHVFQFMKKPWQPEELIAAVRQAASEFDRLEAWRMSGSILAAEVTELKQRVSALETEVQRLSAHHSGNRRAGGPAGRRLARNDGWLSLANRGPMA